MDLQIENLILQIEIALLTDNGDDLHVAWHMLYDLHPAAAIEIAEQMRPLMGVSHG